MRARALTRTKWRESTVCYSFAVGEFVHFAEHRIARTIKCVCSLVLLLLLLLLPLTLSHRRTTYRSTTSVSCDTMSDKRTQLICNAIPRSTRLHRYQLCDVRAEKVYHSYASRVGASRYPTTYSPISRTRYHDNIYLRQYPCTRVQQHGHHCRRPPADTPISLNRMRAYAGSNVQLYIAAISKCLCVYDAHERIFPARSRRPLSAQCGVVETIYSV